MANGRKSVVVHLSIRQVVLTGRRELRQLLSCSLLWRRWLCDAKKCTTDICVTRPVLQ